MQRFTLADVAQRDGRGGSPLWIVYKDGVYDVTNYVNEHPGGVDAIAEEAGSEATKAFDEVGHSKDARDIMAKRLKIGEVVDEEKKYDENGKKIKRVVKAAPEESGSGRSCMSIVTCGLVG